MQTRSIKVIYLYEEDALFSLKKEPWIVDTVNHLSMVPNYQKITFGDGAKVKDNLTPATTVSRTSVVACGEKALPRNFWFDDK